MVNYQELQNSVSATMLGRVLISGDSLEVDQTAEDVMDALRLIEPLLFWKECKTVGIFLGTKRPFRFPTTLSEVVFDVGKSTLHATFDNVCLIDCSSEQHVQSKNLRVAAILEELVHAFMHIHCEAFVKDVVSLILPSVLYRNGSYLDRVQDGTLGRHEPT